MEQDHNPYASLNPSGTKRLMGLRDFPMKTQEEKIALLKSKQRLLALETITAETYPRRKKDIKKGVVLEVEERNLIPTDILKKCPLVYIGSGTDIEYPLALGARSVVMVDPILNNEGDRQEFINKIKSLISRDPIEVGDKLDFQFDFGEGEEAVSVELIAKEFPVSEAQRASINYQLPENTGVILLFASQGEKGQITSGRVMREKLTDGGVIIEEYSLIKKDGTKLELGN